MYCAVSVYICVCVRVCVLARFFEPTSQRAPSSYLAQEEQLCLATTATLQSKAEQTPTEDMFD